MKKQLEKALEIRKKEANMKLNSIVQAIGHTPLVSLPRDDESQGQVYLKIESGNPGGSIKDRAALYIIRDAEEKGLLDCCTIVEATSGNMGIGLAMIGRALGYRVIIVMPESMSKERIQLMKAYGAEVILTSAEGGMQEAVDKAEALSRDHGYFMARQFDNPANAQAHYETTGPEIYNELKDITAFIAGIGTGGTITGTGKYLKEQDQQIKIYGIEPSDSPLLTKGYAGSHTLQGIGANFVPSILDREILDEVLTITGDEAKEACRQLVLDTGILSGISSGANLAGAQKLAKKLGKDAKIVTVVVDSGEKYLSTGLYDELL